MAKVISKHRSRRLAEQHRRRLDKTTKLRWRIASRRDARGHFSRTGHKWVFESLPPELKEWLVTWEYKRKKGRRVLDFYVIAASEDDALNLVDKAVLAGRDDLGYDLSWASRERENPINWDSKIAAEYVHEPGEKIEFDQEEHVEVI